MHRCSCPRLTVGPSAGGGQASGLQRTRILSHPCQLRNQSLSLCHPFVSTTGVSPQEANHVHRTNDSCGTHDSTPTFTTRPTATRQVPLAVPCAPLTAPLWLPSQSASWSPPGAHHSPPQGPLPWCPPITPHGPLHWSLADLGTFVGASSAALLAFSLPPLEALAVMGPGWSHRPLLSCMCALLPAALPGPGTAHCPAAGFHPGHGSTMGPVMMMWEGPHMGPSQRTQSPSSDCGASIPPSPAWLCRGAKAQGLRSWG